MEVGLDERDLVSGHFDLKHNNTTMITKKYPIAFFYSREAPGWASSQMYSPATLWIHWHLEKPKCRWSSPRYGCSWLGTTSRIFASQWVIFDIISESSLSKLYTKRTRRAHGVVSRKWSSVVNINRSSYIKMHQHI